MYNRTIAIDCLTAWACWIIGAGFSLGDWLRFTPEDSGYAGIALIAFGHLVSTHRVVARLEERERAAFELGKEAGSVRGIR